MFLQDEINLKWSFLFLSCVREKIAYGCQLRSRTLNTCYGGIRCPLCGDLMILKGYNSHECADSSENTIIHHPLTLGTFNLSFRSCLQLDAMLPLRSLWRNLPVHVWRWASYYPLHASVSSRVDGDWVNGTFLK